MEMIPADSFNNWVVSNISDEVGELERVLEDFYKIEPSKDNLENFTQAFETGKPIILTAEILHVLQNCDWEIVRTGKLENVKALIAESNLLLPSNNQRSVDKIVDGFLNNRQMELPLICRNSVGQLHLVSGNTRLIVCKALNIIPQAVVADFL